MKKNYYEIIAEICFYREPNRIIGDVICDDNPVEKKIIKDNPECIRKIDVII